MRNTVELGCPGHFIAVKDCNYRRHTQIGRAFRVSTVGDYYPLGEGRRPLASFEGSLFESMVFLTNSGPDGENEGCGCRAVKSLSSLETRYYRTAGEAQRGHEALVRKYRSVRAKR